MSVQIVLYKPDFIFISVYSVHKIINLAGIIYFGAMFLRINMAPTLKWSCKHKNRTSPVSYVLKILFFDAAWFHRNAFITVFEQLHGLFVHTNKRNIFIVWERVNSQNIFHLRDKFTTLFCRNYPFLLQVRFKFSFFKLRRTVSRLMPGAISS
jgi:hypothetical protein